MCTTIGLSLALLIVSAASWAKQVNVAHHRHQSAEGIKLSRNNAAAARRRSATPHHARIAQGKIRAARTGRRAATIRRARADAQGYGYPPSGSLPEPDRYIGPLQAVGPAEVGTAAWYGGRHLGARTASGERLDEIHATAAHRSLPLHSMVRVTNLRNGRSAIATINDRGPVSRSLLIDLSPRVAKELDMIRSGLARVSIVPVAAVHTD